MKTIALTAAAAKQFDALPSDARTAIAAGLDLYAKAEAVAALKALHVAEGTESLPPEVSARILRGDSRLTAWRKYRGHSQVQLAALAGISQSYLSQLENAQRDGDPETLAALAAALDIGVGMIA